ncbi:MULTISPECIES: YfhD family protein [Metabacillus]|uniref:YfhD family protein n=1 Tax=Metabacillus hrfriensis TaxID=3048891 RepID=A0ACD4RE49_9BACI|nr:MULTISPECIES: YfhD family protein [Metabacillus]UAL52888.1 YfhD family protein [Metabacillus dongyingensis]UOK58506.1 YfhD family protein [Bacillus sp. OVS6]WHZ58427.1 YfhD family protein [Metabacillus sp. CT-WN-B3]
MGRANSQHSRSKSKNDLAQVPKNLKKESDGVYEEYSAELADQADKTAQARAKAADERQGK